ncbi:MAG: zf-HC2 domain-containing protein [Acidobacteriota bacterium]|nr:MAG: zf-HC2 domain-containing protein [Acidobacteriota bacterium]
MCNRQVLRSYITGQLEEDDRLDFLMHLDDCPNCWEAVYSAAKAEHPHWYKRASRRSNSKLELEMRNADLVVDTENEGNQKVFEVA